MPIREKSDVKKSRGIAGAMAADEAVMQAQLKSKPVAEKKVMLGGQTNESWRNYWMGRIKGEGKTAIGLIEEMFMERYGTPDNPK